MHWSKYAAAAATLLLAACGPSLTQGARPNGEPAAPARGAEQAAAAQLALGERIFTAVCSACHSLETPPQAAPPMTHVARHYREAFTDREAGVARIMSFVHSPSVERSILPAHAIERWGLMPAQPLPEAELRAVAEYVWQLPEPQRGMGGHQPLMQEHQQRHRGEYHHRGWP